MASQTAVASPSFESLPADRAVHRRRPAAFVAWLAVGCIGTWIDKIHEHLGVVAYPDKEWIGEQLPVSPIYLGATVGFFLLYTWVVGHRGRAQGLFGGRPLSFADLVFAHGSWIFAYCVTGYLGAPERTHGVLPWVCAAVLAVWAAPDLWAARRTWLPLYAFLLACLGVGFEWTATRHGAFVYPICPSAPCLGASVPVVWLSMLYVHAALYVHRMLGGRYFLFKQVNDGTL